MNNFKLRLITGTVFVGTTVALTIYSNITFMLLLLAIGGIALHEYYRILFHKKLNSVHYAHIMIGLAIISSKLWLHVDYSWFVFGLVFPVTTILVLLSNRHSFKQVAYLISGLFYIAIPLSLFYNSCNQDDYTPLLALNLFILIWSSDTFAYLCGRAFGKHKLFESISPNKTWEGWLGGALLTLLLSMFLAYQWNISFRLNFMVAGCSVIFGTMGDLAESMLKREFNLKDSGKILPGHGGILDRFDALLLSLPFTTTCYYFFME